MEYKRWVIVAVLVFGIGILFGLITPAGVASPFAEDLLEQLGRLLSESQLLTVIFIMANNIFTLVISFILSPLLCLFPFFVLLFNGWLLGFISASVVSEKSLGFLLSGLLPHGVFELPALIMAQAAALSFGIMVIMLILNKESRKILWYTATRSGERIVLLIVMVLLIGIFHTILVTALMEEQTRGIVLANLKQNLRYLVIAIALMVPAAIIEIYITPLLLA